MVRYATVIMVSLLVACGGSSEDTDDSDDLGGEGGACGEITEHNLSILGRVTQDGQPVEGADVWIEERLWTFGQRFGNGITDADGVFEFQAQRVVAVEDCWGTALDYVAVVVRGDDTAEDDMNSSLFDAINSGTFSVDTTAFPIKL